MLLHPERFRKRAPFTPRKLGGPSRSMAACFMLAVQSVGYVRSSRVPWLAVGAFPGQPPSESATSLISPRSHPLDLCCGRPSKATSDVGRKKVRAAAAGMEAAHLVRGAACPWTEVPVRSPIHPVQRN